MRCFFTDKLIESKELLRLARKRARDLKSYFDPYNEIQDKSPEAQTMYFAFVFIEGLFLQEKLNDKARDRFERQIENKLQELAQQMRDTHEIVGGYEKQLQEKMREGKFNEALPYALKLLDYSQTHCVIEGRNSALYKHFAEQNKPIEEALEDL